MLPQFIKCNSFLTNHFRKKNIKENEVAKVRYHKCIDRNVQCGQGENPNEEDFPCLVCYKLNSDNGEEI